MDQMNRELHEGAEKLADACERYNLAKGLSTKRNLEKAIEDYSKVVRSVMKERPRDTEEKQQVTLAAAQNILIFPVIKRTLSEEQIKQLFPTRRAEGGA